MINNTLFDINLKFNITQFLLSTEYKNILK